jgi:hypothetical protein
MEPLISERLKLIPAEIVTLVSASAFVTQLPTWILSSHTIQTLFAMRTWSEEQLFGAL